MAQETNNGASLHYKLFLNQKCVIVWILGSYLMFLPAESLIKGDGKDWQSSVKLWSPLMPMGFICLELKDIRIPVVLHCSKNGQIPLSLV